MFMALQTLWCYVYMLVCDTDRDDGTRHHSCRKYTARRGFGKPSWILGQAGDLQKVNIMMRTPVNDEITLYEPCTGYLIYQGGVDETEGFFRKVL